MWRFRMDLETKEKYELEITKLKAKLYDYIEDRGTLESILKERDGTLQKIASNLFLNEERREVTFDDMAERALMLSNHYNDSISQQYQPEYTEDYEEAEFEEVNPPAPSVDRSDIDMSNYVDQD